MTVDLTEEEARSLATLLLRTIADDPHPLAPRLEPLRAILAKLYPPMTRGGPQTPLKA